MKNILFFILVILIKTLCVCASEQKIWSETSTSNDSGYPANTEPENETVKPSTAVTDPNRDKISKNYILIKEKLDSNDFEGAIVLLKETESLDPDNKNITSALANALNNYAVSLAEDGNYNKAVEIVEEAYVTDSTNPQISDNYFQILKAAANDYIEKKDWFEAINSYTFLIGFGKETDMLKSDISDLYFQWGMELLSKTDSESAKDKFFQGLDFYPYNKNILYQLGFTEYNKHNLVEAKYYWDQLYELDPSNSAISDLVEKLNRELEIEPDLTYKEAQHFDIRYDQAIETDFINIVKNTLENAYRDLGARFSYYPSDKIIVLLLSENYFQYTTNLPHWVAGMYDGKIRIPITGNTDIIKTTVYHEYTHAILHRLSGGKTPRWFEEGLAEYFSERNYSYTLLKSSIAKNNLISPGQLDSKIASGKQETVKLAYEEARMVIEYIIFRYGINKIKFLIGSFAHGGAEYGAITRNLASHNSDFEQNLNQYAVKRLLSITEQKKARRLSRVKASGS